MPRIGQSATKLKFIVYRIKNKRNGKSYIGISNRALGVRFLEHLARARQGKRDNRLSVAIRKYGEQAFSSELLASAATEDEVRKLETHYINKYDSYQNGYNCNLGGFGFLVFPDHIKEKISKAQKGKIISKESREKMSLAKIGNSACADNFGEFTAKGAYNPLARSYLFRFPDGSEHVVSGFRAFCRERSVNARHLKTRGHSKGYVLLRRLNDHPRAGSTAKRPEIAETREGQNMVYSAPKDAALGNGLGL